MLKKYFKPNNPDTFLDDLEEQIRVYSSFEQEGYYQGLAEIVLESILKWVKDNNMELSNKCIPIGFLPVSVRLNNLSNENLQFQLPVPLTPSDKTRSWLDRIIGITSYYSNRTELKDLRYLRGMKNTNLSTLQRLKIDFTFYGKEVNNPLKDLLIDQDIYNRYIDLKVTNTSGSKMRRLKYPINALIDAD